MKKILKTFVTSIICLSMLFSSAVYANTVDDTLNIPIIDEVSSETEDALSSEEQSSGALSVLESLEEESTLQDDTETEVEIETLSEIEEETVRDIPFLSAPETIIDANTFTVTDEMMPIDGQEIAIHLGDYEDDIEPEELERRLAFFDRIRDENILPFLAEDGKLSYVGDVTVTNTYIDPDSGIPSIPSHIIWMIFDYTGTDHSVAYYKDTLSGDFDSVFVNFMLDYNAYSNGSTAYYNYNGHPDSEEKLLWANEIYYDTFNDGFFWNPSTGLDENSEPEFTLYGWLPVGSEVEITKEDKTTAESKYETAISGFLNDRQSLTIYGAYTYKTIDPFGNDFDPNNYPLNYDDQYPFEYEIYLSMNGTYDENMDISVLESKNELLYLYKVDENSESGVSDVSYTDWGDQAYLKGAESGTYIVCGVSTDISYLGDGTLLRNEYGYALYKPDGTLYLLYLPSYKAMVYDWQLWGSTDNYYNYSYPWEEYKVERGTDTPINHIVVTEDVDYIPPYAFCNTKGMTTEGAEGISVEILNNNCHIGQHAFDSCQLNSLDLGETKYIYASAFEDALFTQNMTDKENLFANVEYFGERSLRGLNNETSEGYMQNWPRINFTNAKYIGSRVFNGSKVETVYLGTSLQTLEAWAFAGCNELREVLNLENTGVKILFVGTFENCGALTTINTSNIEVVSYCPQYDESMYLEGKTYGRKDSIKFGYDFSYDDFMLQVTPEQWPGTYFTDGAFYSCVNLRSVDLSNCIIVGALAFTNCHELEVTVGENLRVIDRSAFSVYNYPVTLHGSLENCEIFCRSAFGNTSNLITDNGAITLTKARYIGARAFYTCYDGKYVLKGTLKDCVISCGGLYSAFPENATLDHCYIRDPSIAGKGSYNDPYIAEKCTVKNCIIDSSHVFNAGYCPKEYIFIDNCFVDSIGYTDTMHFSSDAECCDYYSYREFLEQNDLVSEVNKRLSYEETVTPENILGNTSKTEKLYIENTSAYNLPSPILEGKFVFDNLSNLTIKNYKLRHVPSGSFSSYSPAGLKNNYSGSDGESVVNLENCTLLADNYSIDGIKTVNMTGCTGLGTMTLKEAEVLNVTDTQYKRIAVEASDDGNLGNAMLKNSTFGHCDMWGMQNLVLDNCEFSDENTYSVYWPVISSRTLKTVTLKNMDRTYPYMFYDNVALETVTFDNNMKSIDICSFTGCDNLGVIDFKNVETILAGAFLSCGGNSIGFDPNAFDIGNIKYIEDYAFSSNIPVNFLPNVGTDTLKLEGVYMTGLSFSSSTYEDVSDGYGLYGLNISHNTLDSELNNTVEGMRGIIAPQNVIIKDSRIPHTLTRAVDGLHEEPFIRNTIRTITYSSDIIADSSGAFSDSVPYAHAQDAVITITGSVLKGNWSKSRLHREIDTNGTYLYIQYDGYYPSLDDCLNQAESPTSMQAVAVNSICLSNRNNEYCDSVQSFNGERATYITNSIHIKNESSDPTCQLELFCNDIASVVIEDMDISQINGWENHIHETGFILGNIQDLTFKNCTVPGTMFTDYMYNSKYENIDFYNCTFEKRHNPNYDTPFKNSITKMSFTNTNIPEGMFNGFYTLEEVNFINSDISDNCFVRCENLTKITADLASDLNGQNSFYASNAEVDCVLIPPEYGRLCPGITTLNNKEYTIDTNNFSYGEPPAEVDCCPHYLNSVYTRYIYSPKAERLSLETYPKYSADDFLTTRFAGNFNNTWKEHNWEACNRGFVVTFDSAGGTSVADQEVKHNNIIDFNAANPTKTIDGKVRRLKHWVDADGIEVNTNYPILWQCNLTAVYSGTYLVQFVTNGGSEVPPQTVEEDSTSVKPDDPTREYTDFVAWYENPELTGQPFNFNTSITKNTTLYAKWDGSLNKDIQVTPTLDSEGNVSSNFVLTVNNGRTDLENTLFTDNAAQWENYNLNWLGSVNSKIKQDSTKTSGTKKQRTLVFDITLNSKVFNDNGSSIENSDITETPTPLRMSLSLPAGIDYDNVNISISRTHNGTVKQLESTLDKVNNRIEFSSDKFSIYTLSITDKGYTEDKKEDNKPKPTPTPKSKDDPEPKYIEEPAKEEDTATAEEQSNIVFIPFQTGDNIYIFVAFAIAIINAVILLFFIYKIRNSDNED